MITLGEFDQRAWGQANVSPNSMLGTWLRGGADTSVLAVPAPN